MYFVFFAYFLLLYSKRTRQKENLLYSLFSLAFALYSACRTDIKYEFISNFGLLQKLEFGSMYAAIPLLMAFVLSFFREKQTRFHYGYYVFSAVCLAALAAMRNHLHWYNLNVYFIQYLDFPFFELFHPRQTTQIRRHRICSQPSPSYARRSRHPAFMGNTDSSVHRILAHSFAMFACQQHRDDSFGSLPKSMNQIEELNATLERKIGTNAALDKSLQEISLRDENQRARDGRIQSASPAPGAHSRLAGADRCAVRPAVNGILPLRQNARGLSDASDVSGHGTCGALRHTGG